MSTISSHFQSNVLKSGTSPLYLPSHLLLGRSASCMHLWECNHILKKGTRRKFHEAPLSASGLLASLCQRPRKPPFFSPQHDDPPHAPLREGAGCRVNVVGRLRLGLRSFSRGSFAISSDPLLSRNRWIGWMTCFIGSSLMKNNIE